MKRYYYDCSRCRYTYTRPNGHKGCRIIDEGTSFDYPIFTVDRLRSPVNGCSVCAKYYPVDLAVTPTRKAKKLLAWEMVKKCSNCRDLVHRDAKMCPHCGAAFEEEEQNG